MQSVMSPDPHASTPSGAAVSDTLNPVIGSGAVCTVAQTSTKQWRPSVGDPGLSPE